MWQIPIIVLAFIVYSCSDDDSTQGNTSSCQAIEDFPPDIDYLAIDQYAITGPQTNAGPLIKKSATEAREYAIQHGGKGLNYFQGVEKIRRTKKQIIIKIRFQTVTMLGKFSPSDNFHRNVFKKSWPARKLKPHRVGGVLMQEKSIFTKTKAKQEIGQQVMLLVWVLQCE